MQVTSYWTTELQCFRCGKKLIPRFDPEATLAKIVFIDAGDRRRHPCCKGCVRPTDRVV